jgi:5-methylcytosine-specific restriction enzyme A
MIKPTERANANERGYTYEWQRASKRFLWLHPLCVHCEKAGRYKLARCVDHVIPHKGDQQLFWDQANWQSLCLDCHNAKTLREKGKQPKPRIKIGVDGYPIG